MVSGQTSFREVGACARRDRQGKTARVGLSLKFAAGNNFKVERIIYATERRKRKEGEKGKWGRGERGKGEGEGKRVDESHAASPHPFSPFPLFTFSPFFKRHRVC